MKTTNLCLFAILFLFSCQKEKLNIPQNSITDLTSDYSGQLQTRTQLRLAFGKTVANALVHPDFRKYIKKTSQTNEFKGFNEIVFALHQNDQVTEDATLKQLLTRALDDETIEIFGRDFLDDVLENDPLVTIKLPDIFYHFNWDEERLIPTVAIKTPEFLTDDDLIYYQMYHHSGYGELVAPWKDLKYFCLIVKYSEDYILWNDQLNTTEKGISLFEFLPQAENCWDLIKNSINQASIHLPALSNLKYLKKRDYFYYYQQLCEPGFYGFEESCKTEPCIRDCKNGEQVTTYLEGIEFEPINFKVISHKSPIFDETMHLAMPLSNSAIGDIYYTKPITIIGYRKCEFFDLKFNYVLNPTRVHFKDLGTFTLPEISLDNSESYEQSTLKKDINLYLFTGWPIDKNDHVKFSFYILSYEDKVNQISVANWWSTKCSDAFEFGSSPEYQIGKK